MGQYTNMAMVLKELLRVWRNFAPVAPSSSWSWHRHFMTLEEITLPSTIDSSSAIAYCKDSLHQVDFWSCNSSIPKYPVRNGKRISCISCGWSFYFLLVCKVGDLCINFSQAHLISCKRTGTIRPSSTATATQYWILMILILSPSHDELMAGVAKRRCACLDHKSLRQFGYQLFMIDFVLPQSIHIDFMVKKCGAKITSASLRAIVFRICDKGTSPYFVLLELYCFCRCVSFTATNFRHLVYDSSTVTCPCDSTQIDTCFGGNDFASGDDFILGSSSPDPLCFWGWVVVSVFVLFYFGFGVSVLAQLLVSALEFSLC